MKRTEPLRISLLRSLRDDGPQTSMQLTKRLDPYPGKDLTQQRNGVNGRLGDMYRAGHAEIAATVPSPYHNTPAYLWAITPAGKRELTAHMRKRAARQKREEARDERAEAKESALRSLIRQALHNKWGPGTPTAERREISRRLRAQGMPYDWIAAVFEVSHEIVRQDCNGFVRRNGLQVRAESLVVPPRGTPGYVWERTRESAGAA